MYKRQALLEAEGKSAADLQLLLEKTELQIDPHARKLVEMWPQVKESYSGDEYVVKIRDKEVRSQITVSYTHLDVYKRQVLCRVYEVSLVQTLDQYTVNGGGAEVEPQQVAVDRNCLLYTSRCV